MLASSYGGRVIFCQVTELREPKETLGETQARCGNLESQRGPFFQGELARMYSVAFIKKVI